MSAATGILSLACVMAGALLVHGLLVRLVLRRPAPVLAPRFVLPSRSDLDRPLIAGAALFGVGWGLGGFCPGPAVTALGGGMPEAVVFVSAMLAGMAVEHVSRSPPRQHRRSSLGPRRQVDRVPRQLAMTAPRAQPPGRCDGLLSKTREAT